MRKTKIFSKLFKFVDTKSWRLEKGVNTNIYSYFYNEYTLQFLKKDTTWIYVVYDGRGTDSYYNKNIAGIIAFNKAGKMLFTFAIGLLIGIILSNFTNYNNYYCYIASFIFSYLLSFFVFSIFNWSIYMSFRRAKYAVYNVEKIKKKEDNEQLNDRVINVVNKAISKDPKLSRKMKLNQLKKKHFWDNWFNKENEFYEGESAE